MKAATAHVFLCALLCATAGASNPLEGIPISMGDKIVPRFNGTMTITHFAKAGDAKQLLAQGTCTGTAVTADGTFDYSNGTPCQAVVDSINGVNPASLHGKPNRKLLQTCNIVTLDLSGLFLNLLGLTVNIPALTVLIDAVAGAGNLLGNLLCAVVNLLNGVGGLAGLIALLNQIVTILQGLGL
jgi:hypothetical protein